MRNLFLLAVILHLAIIIIEINGTFRVGDIISYGRKCPCSSALIYKHFAIYTGETARLLNKNGNIFHHTKTGWLQAGCVFGDVNEPGTPHVENYLDTIPNIRIGTEKEILTRISEKIANCEPYHVLYNNCEHLATYIRYGITRAEQHDTLAEWLARRLCQRGLKPCPKLDEKWEKVLKDLDENAKLEEKCINTCRNSG